MIARRHRHLLSQVMPVAFVSLAHAPVALAAPTKAECVDANTEAQDLRRTGKLLAAREALRMCAKDACPRLVRTDCTKRQDEVEAAIPSIVFVAKNAAGEDLSDVAVTVDGKPLIDHLDGTSLDVDPGQHSFVFTTAGQPAKTLQFVIRETERGRRETVVIGSPAHAAAAKPAAPPQVFSDTTVRDPADGTSPSGSTQRLLGWSALGLGVAGVGVGVVFELRRSSKLKSRDDICKGGAPEGCPAGSQARVDSLSAEARSASTIGSLALIAGGVLAAGGAVLLLTDPSQTSTQVSLIPVLGPQFQGVMLRGYGF